MISSWLLDLTASALTASPDLQHFSGHVADSGEGRWTIEAAIEEAVPANVLSAALFARFRSREEHTFGEKVLSAMRFGFGGHVEQPRRRPQPLRARPSEPMNRADQADRCRTIGRRVTPPRSAAAAGRPLRHGDLRRRRRPDQAARHAGALQSRLHAACCPTISSSSGVDHNRQTDESLAPNLTEMMQSFVGGTGEFDPSKIDQKSWAWLTERMFYLKGDFEDPKTYEAIRDKLAGFEQEPQDRRQRPVLSRRGGPVLRHAWSTNSARPSWSQTEADDAHAPWRRVVIEKPFGHDLPRPRTSTPAS